MGGGGTGGGGGGCVHLEYSPSLTVGRTSSTAINCSSKAWKIRPAVPDLHNEATEPVASLMHVSQCRSQILIFKNFFFYVCPILHRPTQVHCWDRTFPHRECSRPSFATPSGRPTSSSLSKHTVKSSASFTRFLARRQSVVSLSCVTVYTSTHQTRTL